MFSPELAGSSSDFDSEFPARISLVHLRLKIKTTDSQYAPCERPSCRKTKLGRAFYPIVGAMSSGCSKKKAPSGSRQKGLPSLVCFTRY